MSKDTAVYVGLDVQNESISVGRTHRNIAGRRRSKAERQVASGGGVVPVTAQPSTAL